MTDSDDALARRYRELSREEPRAALDDAILAASRRAVARPSLTRRWAAPVSIAAVLVLAFGLTLEMEHEKPEVASPVDEVPRAPAEPQPAPEVVVAPAAPSSPAKKSISPPPAQPARKAKPAAGETRAARPAADEASAARSEERPDASVREAAPFPASRANTTSVTVAPPPAPAAAPAQPAPLPPPAPQSAPSLERAAPVERARDAFTPAAPASAGAPATAQSAARLAPRMKAESADAAPPAAKAGDIERELEAIAKLRGEGRDAEADKALADFRSEHPGYRIPEAMWDRVRRR